jgi:hypothetical protein
MAWPASGASRTWELPAGPACAAGDNGRHEHRGDCVPQIVTLRHIRAGGGSGGPNRPRRPHRPGRPDRLHGGRRRTGVVGRRQASTDASASTSTSVYVSPTRPVNGYCEKQVPAAPQTGLPRILEDRGTSGPRPGRRPRCSFDRPCCREVLRCADEFSPGWPRWPASP